MALKELSHSQVNDQIAPSQRNFSEKSTWQENKNAGVLGTKCYSGEAWQALSTKEHSTGAKQGTNECKLQQPVQCIQAVKNLVQTKTWA